MRELVKVNVLWFKRDLRLHDHTPITDACAAGLPILPLYIVDPDYWRQVFSSRAHWHFIFDCLVELREECSKLGQPLLVLRGDTINVLQGLADKFLIDEIYAHEETGGDWSRQRDERVRKWCRSNSTALREYPSNGVIRELTSRDDWSKLRDHRINQPLIPKPKRLRGLNDLIIGDIPSKTDPMFGNIGPNSWQSGGRSQAEQALSNFLKKNSIKYLEHISDPALSETYCSRISPHLTWGTLSVKEVISSLRSRRRDLRSIGEASWSRNLRAFESRLAWRCHFIQKLEDQPSIENTSMHSALEEIRGAESKDHRFDNWARGTTGFPIIDACMRSLLHGGWITFRMRAMLVSFASYNLWIDWRHSGHHLARLFTDYEPGIHYSQLQMQSGVTSINALRIYNPLKQSITHDATGEFIRRWVPEIRQLPDSWIHHPWKMSRTLQLQTKCIIGKAYPKPLVDHEITAKIARERIKLASQGEDFRRESKQIFEKLGSRRRGQSKRNRRNQKQLKFLL